MAGLAVAAYVLVGRPRVRRLGATATEVAAGYPGDDLVSGGHPTTMATTLPAPPEDVWPWLVQMGCDRAGWYSWDRLDNGGRPSADHLHPEWQDLGEGDRMHATPGGSAWFTAVVVDPPRTLVLRSDIELPSGRAFDPTGPLPRAFAEGVWGFHLRPADDGRATRLVVRTRGRSAPQPLMTVVDVFVGEPAHAIMQTRQFHNLHERLATPTQVKIT